MTMFTNEDFYPIFFEVYKKRHRFSHMQLECIPLPKDIGELAPMYFKVCYRNIFLCNLYVMGIE